MQFARTPVIVQAIRRVGLLLRFHDHRSRPQRVHRAAGNINHVAGKNIDPVQQFFGALLVDRLFQLLRASRPASGPAQSARPAWREPRTSTRSCPRAGPRAAACVIVGMHLHRKLLVRETETSAAAEIASGRAPRRPPVRADIARSIPPASFRSAGRSRLCSRRRSATPRRSSPRTGDWDKSATDRACPRDADQTPGSINNG